MIGNDKCRADGGSDSEQWQNAEHRNRQHAAGDSYQTNAAINFDFLGVFQTKLPFVVANTSVARPLQPPPSRPPTAKRLALAVGSVGLGDYLANQTTIHGVMDMGGNSKGKKGNGRDRAVSEKPSRQKQRSKLRQLFDGSRRSLRPDLTCKLP